MPKITLVAVDVRSSHNVGSFLRTCDGFGAEVVLCGITPRPKGAENEDRLPHISDSAHKAISKTALGAENTVKWRYFIDTKTAVDTLRNEGSKIIAIEQDSKSKNISELKLDTDIALLLGPEVEGLPTEILSLCDEIYEIPMKGGKESFNVSVSAGIALYAATSQTLYSS